MLRKMILLTLVLILTFCGCCYAPGYEGEDMMQKMLGVMPTLPPQEYIPLGGTSSDDGDSVTESVATDELVPIPDPEIDLASMPQREDDDFVDVLDYIPDLVVDLKYATVDNFTGEAIYSSNAVYLRYGTVVKLMEVQKELRAKGMLLKLWDGYRTIASQQKLWEANPDPEYVSDPSFGASSHSRGNTVDVTVVTGAGQELTMPTGFDDFTVLADRDYSDCSAAAAENATMLQEIMERNGFEGYEKEWWHYSDQTTYEVENVFDPNVMGTYFADCNEFITLRDKPAVTGNAITRILVKQQVTLLGKANDDFSLVEFEGQWGYVMTSYLSPVE